MYSSHGISYEADLLDLAAENKVVDRSGSWFTFGSTKLGQGRDRARQFLEENRAVAAEIRERILSLKNLSSVAGVVAETEAAAEAEED
jgi:recombination protein RecA